MAIKLHITKRNKRGKTYCGPTVLSSLSGKSYNDTISFINRITCHSTHRETKWMSFDALQDCIISLGFHVEADYFDLKDDSNPLPTMKTWINNRDSIGYEMGDDPENDTWVLNLTRHFVLIQGNSFVDNHAEKIITINEAPFQRKRIKRILKVWQ